MPEAPIAGVVARVRRRARTRAALWSGAVGGATATAVSLAAMLTGLAEPTRLLWSATAGLAAGISLLWRGWPLTAIEAAGAIERAWPLDNLLITAVELGEQPRPVRADLHDEILRQAQDRIAALDVAGVVPLRQPLAVMLTVTAGTVAMLTLGAGGSGSSLLGRADVQAITRGIEAFSVAVTPPPYSGLAGDTWASPVQISVAAGSRVTLLVTTAAEGVTAEFAGRPAMALTRAGGLWTGEWVADQTTAVSLRPAGGDARDGQFLSVIVVPDLPPVVQVPAPGRDLTVSGSKGQITIEVDARDDLGMAALALRFTKASGGGESLTFTEGEVPLAITRVDARHWRGRAVWVLDGLNLSDGDVLVYRAVGRDRNPKGSPVQSEQYLVEVGGLAGAVGAGFALPAEEKKYAISQQMVIYKTEQLIASAKGAPAAGRGDGWLQQNQLLAVEQRMVRAEVVFLGGGEVQDEVEEAAHSHEVAEGRLENTGRAEMLRAINFMSLAEAQLNDGNAGAALVLEREALKSLERAFDRRRYFLRTLPDRSRIEPARRLSGDLKDARSWRREGHRPGAAPSLDQSRSLMRDLAMAAGSGAGIDAGLAARVAALDPAATSLQQAAVALASAATVETRGEAVWRAMQAVTAHALESLGSASTLPLKIDPLAGALADELVRSARGGKQ